MYIWQCLSVKILSHSVYTTRQKKLFSTGEEQSAAAFALGTLFLRRGELGPAKAAFEASLKVICVPSALGALECVTFECGSRPQPLKYGHLVKQLLSKMCASFQ